MAVIDKRNTIKHLHVGGSDSGLAVQLTAAEALAVYGAGSAAGWYIAGTLDGGSIGREVDSEPDKDEAGNLTGKTIVTTDEIVLKNKVKETDDATLKLFEDVLTQSPHRYRYALPAGAAETGEKLHQVWGIYNALAKPGYELATAAGEKRMLEFEIRGSKTDATPAFARATVELTDQATWPVALADFKDAVA